MKTYEDIHIMVLRNDVDGLILAASDADETIRWEAVKALKALNPPKAKEVLELALNDPSPKVRSAASGISQAQVVQQAIEEMAAESNEETVDEDVAKEAESEAFEEREVSQKKLWTWFTVIGASSVLFVILILIFIFILR